MIKQLLSFLYCSALLLICTVQIFAQKAPLELADERQDGMTNVSPKQKELANLNNIQVSSDYYGPSFGQSVYAMHTMGDNIIAGGLFTYMGTREMNYIAYWNGSQWGPMDSGFNNAVIRFKEFNGSLFAIGFFNETGDGRPMHYVAQWTGTGWSELSADIPDYAYSLTYDGTNYYIGTESGVYKWDGNDLNQIASTNSYVDHMEYHNGTLYIAGPFTELNGISANYVAEWDGFAWGSMGSGLNDVVRAMTIYQGKLAIGGYFNSDSGFGPNRVATWNGSAWESIGDFPATSGGALTMSSRDNMLYVGGTIMGGNIMRAAKYDGSDWKPLGAASATVWDVHESDGGAVYLGGAFATAGAEDTIWAFQVDKLRTSSLPGIPVAEGGKNLNGSVYGVASSEDGTVGVAGFFGDSGSEGAYYFSLMENNNWSKLGNYDDSMETIIWHEGNWFLGGDFTEIDGKEIYRIARYDGNVWYPLGKGLDDYVKYLTVHNGDIYAFGHFTATADGSTELNGIARWDGFNWQPLDSGLSGYANVGVSHEGNLFTGGSFTHAGENEANNIARWDGNEWHAVGQGFDSSVWALDTYKNNLVAGGNFTNSGASSELGGIAMFNGFNWNWNDPGFSGTVYDFAKVGDKLFASGSFNGINNDDIKNLAYWNGSVWQSSGNPNGVVYSMAPHGDDGLYIAGLFDSIMGAASFNFAELSGIPINTSIAEDKDEYPVTLQLDQNYPNPFNPVTVISYQLPESSNAIIEVFDMLGRSVDMLLNREMVAGRHQVTFDASNLASGLYIYRLTAGEFTDTKKMNLIK